MTWRSVDAHAVRDAARSLASINDAIIQTTQDLMREHEDVLQHWNDPRSVEFSAYIAELYQAMRGPSQRLSEHILRLTALANSVDTYLNTEIASQALSDHSHRTPSLATPAPPQALESVGETIELIDVVRWFGVGYVNATVELLAKILDAQGVAVGVTVATQWMTNIVQIFVDEQDGAVDAEQRRVTPAETLADARFLLEQIVSVASVPNIGSLIDTYIANGGADSHHARSGTHFQMRVLQAFVENNAVTIEAVEYPRYTPATGQTGDVDIVTIESGKRVANELKAHDWTLDSVKKGSWIEADFAQLIKNITAFEPGQDRPMFDVVRLILPSDVPESLKRRIAEKIATTRNDYVGRVVECVLYNVQTRTFERLRNNL